MRFASARAIRAPAGTLEKPRTRLPCSFRNRRILPNQILRFELRPKLEGIGSSTSFRFSLTRSGTRVPGMMQVTCGCARANCKAAAFRETRCRAATVCSPTRPLQNICRRICIVELGSNAQV